MEQGAINLLLKLGVTEQEISEMTWQQVYEAARDESYNFCSDCGKWVHIDIYNGEQELCDDCI